MCLVHWPHDPDMLKTCVSKHNHQCFNVRLNLTKKASNVARDAFDHLFSSTWSIRLEINRYRSELPTILSKLTPSQLLRNCSIFHVFFVVNSVVVGMLSYWWYICLFVCQCYSFCCCCCSRRWDLRMKCYVTLFDLLKLFVMTRKLLTNSMDLTMTK